MRQGGLTHAAGRVRSKKHKRKSPSTKTHRTHKTHHGIHSNPAIATSSRPRARKHAPRLSPYSPASIDPGFAKVGLVQLSQSEKTSNVTHRLTDLLNSGTLYTPHPGQKPIEYAYWFVNRLGYCTSIPIDTSDRYANTSIDTDCLDQ